MASSSYAHWHGYAQAFVPSEYMRTPTMHLFEGVWPSRRRPGEQADFTLCGREMGKYDIHMSIRHASLFAKPCKVCDRIAARQAAA